MWPSPSLARALNPLRDRLGTLEGQFFATVFRGSGLLFLGMLFGAAAALGASMLLFGTSGRAVAMPSKYRRFS